MRMHWKQVILGKCMQMSDPLASAAMENWFWDCTAPCALAMKYRGVQGISTSTGTRLKLVW